MPDSKLRESNSLHSKFHYTTMFISNNMHLSRIMKLFGILFIVKDLGLEALELSGIAFHALMKAGGDFVYKNGKLVGLPPNSLKVKVNVNSDEKLALWKAGELHIKRYIHDDSWLLQSNKMDKAFELKPICSIPRMDIGLRDLEIFRNQTISKNFKDLKLYGKYVRNTNKFRFASQSAFIQKVLKFFGRDLPNLYLPTAYIESSSGTCRKMYLRIIFDDNDDPFNGPSAHLTLLNDPLSNVGLDLYYDSHSNIFRTEEPALFERCDLPGDESYDWRIIFSRFLGI